MEKLRNILGKTKNRDLILSGNLIKAILLLAIPIIINNFIQTMYNLVDTYWLGQIGKDQMAAITLVSPMQAIIVNFGQGITVAGSILISQYVGAGEIKQAKTMAAQIFVCSISFSIICASICFIATPSIVSWLGAEENVLEYGITYIRIILIDMPFLFIINIYTGINQAQGDTIKPMILNLSGIILNMFLDPLFLIYFKLDVAGAALATLLAKLPCVIIAIISITNPKNELRVRFRDFKFDKGKIKKIIKIGLPTAIGGSTMQLGFLLMSKSVMEFGTTAVAAYGIGNKINGIISMPSTATGSATATIVGQNIGANQIERAEAAYKLARKAIVIFLFISGIILSREFIANSIVGIFSDDKQVISWATDFLSIMAICCWTNGIQNTTSGLFQGSGHTFILMILDATRLWVFRFLTIWFCQEILNMGVESIWYSVVVSNAISSFVIWVLYKANIWKRDAINIRK